MKNKKILIVEDHLALRMSLSSWISELFPSLEIHTAANGGDAVELAENINPDYAIVDISLPDFSGFDVVQMIKHNNPGSTVVILTIHEGKKYQDEAVRVGAAAFVTKREMLHELPSTLHNLFNRKN